MEIFTELSGLEVDRKVPIPIRIRSKGLGGRIPILIMRKCEYCIVICHPELTHSTCFNRSGF